MIEWLAEHISQSYISFDRWFIDNIQTPPLLMLGAVLGVCFVWRLARAILVPRRESKRRRALIQRLKSFISDAESGMTGMLEQLEVNRLQAQAIDWTNRRPVSDLQQVYGVGPATIQAIYNHGYQTLGQVKEYGIRQVQGIGNVKSDFAYRFYYDVLSDALDGFARSDSRYQRNPEIDARYDSARATLVTRGHTLSADAVRLIELGPQVEQFDADSRDQTFGTVFKKLLLAPFRAFTHPLRPLALFATAAVLVILCFGLPHLILSWDFGWSRMAGFFGLSLAYFAFIYMTLCYFVLSDWSLAPSARAPNAKNFAEQRLQLMALELAYESKIAPPQVFVVADPSIGMTTVGGPSGPSRIVVHDGCFANLSDDALRAYLANGIGRLAGDQQRLTVTVHWLRAPLTILTRFAVNIATWFWVKGTQEIGDKTLYCSPFWASGTVLAGSLATLRLAFSNLSLALGRQREYAADKHAAGLCGGNDTVLDYLEALKEQVYSYEAVEFDPLFELNAIKLEYVPEHRRYTHQIMNLLDGLADATPSTGRRMTAIQGGGSASADFAGTIVQAALMVSISSVMLWQGGLLAHQFALYAVDDLGEKLDKVGMVVSETSLTATHARAQDIALQRAQTGSYCSTKRGKAKVKLIGDWSGYRCMNRRRASARWRDCLARAKYTSVRGKGCPGEQRCCPPRFKRSKR
jgi:Zn-dependent protease with chaperone function